MAAIPLTELLRRRHRNLEARIASLEVDARARRPRVVQLAEDLVAHATVEQLVVYPYAEQRLGVRDLALEIERALDELLGVVGGIDDDRDFSVAIARLSCVFDRHVDGDEVGLLPMIETLGDPEQLVRMGETIKDFERAISTCRTGQGFWSEDVAEVAARGGRN
jgi:hypothetical protein